jgi:1-phosphatidylinositol-3-phosphate 5-kinase
VGVDRENNALVVAMIDYIRTYTLDKRMETLIKGSGLMGGDGKVREVTQRTPCTDTLAMWQSPR